MQIEMYHIGYELWNLHKNIYIHIVFLLILGDIATGYLKAYRSNILNSKRGIEGLLKHALTFVIVSLVYTYSRLLNFDYVANGALIVVAISYGISLIENLEQMGVWIPDFIKNKLSKVKDQVNNGG